MVFKPSAKTPFTCTNCSKDMTEHKGGNCPAADAAETIGDPDSVFKPSKATPYTCSTCGKDLSDHLQGAKCYEPAPIDSDDADDDEEEDDEEEFDAFWR